jgi:DNA-binding XRE family transcriptional regulator
MLIGFAIGSDIACCERGIRGRGSQDRNEVVESVRWADGGGRVMLEPVVAGTHELRAKPLLRVLLGDVLRGVRREQGRTLADVARTARISMPYLSELERGRKEASSEVLAAVCEALRVELADVLVEVGRTLAADRVRRTAVVRLGTGTVRPGTARPADTGDVLCLAA